MLLVTFFSLLCNQTARAACHISYQKSINPVQREIKLVVTSEYVKLRVLSLLRQGKKISETVRELQDVDGVKIDRRTVASSDLFSIDEPSTR